MSNQRNGELDMDLRRALIQKRVLLQSPTFDDQEWTTTNQDFSSSMVFIKKELKNQLPVSLIKKHQWWYKFLPNPSNPKKSKHVCKLCEKYSAKLGWANKNLPKLKEAVEIEDTLEDNINVIKRHTQTSAHQRIVENLKVEKRKNIHKDIETILKEQFSANNIYSVTDTIITAAYYCARLRSSKCFVMFVYLLKLKEVPVGEHCSGIKVGQRMISTISAKMHEDLKQHLKANNKPFTIICDSTSDITQSNQFEVLFMAYENDLPMAYHYKLITTTASSTGEAYAEILYKNLEDVSIIEKFTKTKVCVYI